VNAGPKYPDVGIPVQGIATAAAGWEHILDAKIPEQIQMMPTQVPERAALIANTKPAQVGRYTLLCDGATMAALVNATFGVATQLDRAMGYEANASGTSFLDDPLTMLGTFQTASSRVTLTANRSAPGQLATVKWDDEGVVPQDVTLVKEGILSDFQTTREQAAWLAPYYQQLGRPVRSNGCAAAESAVCITLQHTPNLALEPATGRAALSDLVSGIRNGVLVEQGEVVQTDAQARSGLLLSPQMREITNGRLGRVIAGGAVLFNALELWKNVTAIGDASTSAVVPFSQYVANAALRRVRRLPVKGEPPQMTSHSVRAASAIVANQALIDPERKA
jgi:TldD protein